MDEKMKELEKELSDVKRNEEILVELKYILEVINNQISSFVYDELTVYIECTKERSNYKFIPQKELEDGIEKLNKINELNKKRISLMDYLKKVGVYKNEYNPNGINGARSNLGELLKDLKGRKEELETLVKGRKEELEILVKGQEFLFIDSDDEEIKVKLEEFKAKLRKRQKDFMFAKPYAKFVTALLEKDSIKLFKLMQELSKEFGEEFVIKGLMENKFILKNESSEGNDEETEFKEV